MRSNYNVTIEHESDFINKFLNYTSSTPLDDDNIKETFIELFRHKLENAGVIWVNPVALVRFKHPESFIYGKDISYAEHLKEALYLPVAINIEYQYKLDKAYNPIIKAHNDTDGHLTPVIKNFKMEDTYCYKCIRVSEGHVIEIYQCKNTSHKIETINKCSHYADLFELTNSIWFIPTPLFSMHSVRSGLYSDYLVGAYVGLHSDLCPHGQIELCKNASKANNDKLRSAIEWATHLFFLKRLKDQGTEYENTLLKYSKQMHMLRILESPLTKLSDALDATQEHTQRLRAVLYDPSRAIFAAASRTIRYFEEGGDIPCGQLRFKTVHEPGSTGEFRDVRLILAAVICEIFGRMEPMPENEGALLHRAAELLKDDEDIEYSDLRKICRTIIGKDITENYSDLFFDETIIRSAAQCFKEILFRPYKDGDTKFPYLPLLVGFYGLNEQLPVEVEHITDDNYMDKHEFTSLSNVLEHSQLNNINSMFGPNGYLPVPRYSQWISLLLGIVAYVKYDNEAKSELKRVIITTAQDTFEIKMIFFRNVFNSNIYSIYNEMTKYIGKHEITYKALGNFKKPFIDFSMSAEATVVDCSDIFKIKHKHPKFAYDLLTSIFASNDSFIYSCVKATEQSEVT